MGRRKPAARPLLGGSSARWFAYRYKEPTAPVSATVGRIAAQPGTAMGDGLMILVAGPYRSGTGGDPALIQANVDAMTAVSLELYRRGHLPVMGEWFALPLIERAEAEGDAGAHDEIFHPIAERVLAKCDACLRIGGPSEGADRMVRTARELGKAVFMDIRDVP